MNTMVTGDAAKDALIVAARKVHAEQTVHGFNPPHIAGDPALYLAAWVEGKLKVDQITVPTQIWESLHPANVILSLYPKEDTSNLKNFLGVLFSGEVLFAQTKHEHPRTGDPAADLPMTDKVGRLTIGVLVDGTQITLMQKEDEPAPEIHDRIEKLGPVGLALIELSRRIQSFLS